MIESRSRRVAWLPSGPRAIRQAGTASSRAHPVCFATWLLIVLGGCAEPGPPAAVGLLERDRIEIVAETSEPIVEVFATDGVTLEAGAPILQLDAARWQAQRDEADAARAQAAARLAELERGPRAEKVAEARARLRGAESVAAVADTELLRARTLLGKQLISREAVDTALSQRDRALAERDASSSALQDLLAGATTEELAQARAGLAQAQAHLRALELTLERLTVRAPRGGRLDVLPFKLGERPPAGAVVAVLLAGTAPYARVYVPEPARAGIALGASATVYIDGAGEPFAGRVRMASHDPVFTPFYSLTEGDRSRLSFLVEIELQGERASRLPAGVPLRAEFPVAGSQ